MNSLTAILQFTLYFSASLIFLVGFKYAYTYITPHDEWKLVKDNKNAAAALGLVGAIIGFAIALGGAAANSISLVDFLCWAIIALVAQVIAFTLLRVLFMPKIVQRIIDNEVSAGIVLCGVSISVGIVNAACMTY
ncbi:MULTISPECIES: DUF350 domain-containing protein [unclassified Halomonas]|uniref:DUF350 domain-containing protein n=1 Tax=unclassified Halomonas TaxID=2609666 RepID=UPI001C983F61|nr:MULTISPECIES: DUF350 domain-containing protein [unclassified Halomonas]MBY5926142.1 DUF350 domain-containing protein [Halomonas sp. DP4Y7-2]MBY6233184.1 DUF350 domain-containing protein [Halomonas sp. DP4Y7-1]